MYLYADFNECESNEDNNCHEYAQCVDTDGSLAVPATPATLEMVSPVEVH